jgi:hypothetical protein
MIVLHCAARHHIQEEPLVSLHCSSRLHDVHVSKQNGLNEVIQLCMIHEN